MRAQSGTRCDATLFDERAEIGPDTNWFWDPLRCQHVARYLLARSWLARSQIIDLGCGSGHGSALLARDQSCSVVGLDVAPGAVVAASRAWREPNLSFRVGDALHLDFRAGSVDTVVAFESIEHVSDPTTFLDEIRRVLRPGGRLLLSTPDRRYYSPGAGVGESHNPFHPSEMTRSELIDLLRPRFRILAEYGQEPAARDSSLARPRSPLLKDSINLLKDSIKKLTNPFLGRGLLAEALVPMLRSRHYPQLAGADGHVYLMMVCELDSPH
ncbi:MAG: class I SAM-dependent methyltransferase [Chloroflexota bacterium]|nr:class I SAM-dependent methyltransferase [Chloroflexota bacterium]